MKPPGGRGVVVVRRVFVTASLSLLIARHEVVEAPRGVLQVEGGASDATHSRVAGGGSGAGCCGGGPEFGGASGGEDALAGDLAVGGEQVECLVELGGGGVAVQ
jgi:hypothetical protein